ncbi:MAG: hypothetical protein R2816_01330 [Flavobacteriaceae bacterium]|nr:hypothetical protein [Flavobacteriaceae bacterium]
MIYRSFTTQWSDNNIKINYKGGGLFSVFINIFFKNWVSNNSRTYSDEITVNFYKPNNGELVKTLLFDYTRNIENGKVVTYFYNLKLFRATIRSIYKFFFKNSNVVGIPELYMAIIRSAIIEPIEFLKHQAGWELTHANVFVYNDKTYVIVAGSKAGKSTLITNLNEKHYINVLSDNYCFIKDNKVITIEEPFRSGKVSRYHLSFYKRRINGYPKVFEANIDFILVMKRQSQNYISKLTFKELLCEISAINYKEKEGIRFVSDNDPIKIDNKKFLINNSNYQTFELGLAEGLKNIDKVVNIIIQLDETNKRFLTSTKNKH